MADAERNAGCTKQELADGISMALKLEFTKARIENRARVMEYYEGLYHILKSYNCGVMEDFDTVEEAKARTHIKRAIVELNNVIKVARFYQDKDVAEYKRINIEIKLEEESST